MKRQEMLETLVTYGAEKRRLGVVDYSDLVTLSTRVMQDNPGLAAESQGSLPGRAPRRVPGHRIPHSGCCWQPSSEMASR